MSFNILSKNTEKGKTFFPKLAWQRPILAGGDPPTTFGVLKLNFCVRHGNRCILLALTTTLVCERTFVLSKLKPIIFTLPNPHLDLRSSPRLISTGPLHPSLNFHSQPINLIISQGSYYLTVWEISSRGWLHT